MREPAKLTRATRILADRLAKDASFASLVFDLREVMHEQQVPPGKMRMALRFMLHQEAWSAYRREMSAPIVPHAEEDDIDDTGSFEA